MKDYFPDPSLVNSIDFYSSAFHIKNLLRRRGWQDVVPLRNAPYGLMPKEYFDRWNSFTKRKELVGKKHGGEEFERFVAQIILKDYCNPTTFGNKIVDLGKGGDFDILVEAPGETLFYFEVKTTKDGAEKKVNIPDMWNFLVRESALGADMSVFLLDGNYDLKEKVMRSFEMLYALAEEITYNNELLSPDQLRPSSLLEKNPNRIITFHKTIEKEIHYLYYPILVINGGDKIKQNIGKTISLYYSRIKHITPFSRLSRERTGLLFHKLPHWKDLPPQIKKEAVRKKI